MISLLSRHGRTGIPGEVIRLDRQERSRERLAEFKTNPECPKLDAEPPPSVFNDGAREFVSLIDWNGDGDKRPHHGRIRKDLKRVEEANLDAFKFKVGIGGADEVRVLKATLSIGPHLQPAAASSPYSGRAFDFRIVLPRGDGGGRCYPISPPKVCFTTKAGDNEPYLRHYAIDNDGNICLPLIVENWSPTTSLVAICEQVETLIVSPGEIDRTGKYAKQAYLAERLRVNKKAYDKECHEAAQRAPQAHSRDQAMKLKPTFSMLGQCDELRFKKVDKIVAPTQRPPNAPAGWPYSQYQPQLHKVWLGGGPTAFDSDTLERFANQERLKRLATFPLMAVLLMINNLVKKLSWFCLILRSLDGMAAVPDIDERFIDLFRELKLVILSIGFGLHVAILPILNVLERLFSYLFFTLDLSNIMEWIFNLNIIPNAEVTCDGTKQPIYLFCDLVVVCGIIALASADVLDAFKFWHAWDRLIVARGTYGTVISVLGEKIEAGLVYLLRGLILLTSVKPFNMRYNIYCEDKNISWVTLVLAWATLLPFLFLVLSAFVHGAGPAPPHDAVKKRIRPQPLRVPPRNMYQTTPSDDIDGDTDVDDDDAFTSHPHDAAPARLQLKRMWTSDGPRALGVYTDDDDSDSSPAKTTLILSNALRDEERGMRPNSWLSRCCERVSSLCTSAENEYLVWEVGEERKRCHNASELEIEFAGRTELSGGNQIRQVILTIARSDSPTEVEAGVLFYGKVVNEKTNIECSLRLKEEEYWHERDPILSNRDRCTLSHKIFHRSGLIRRGYRAGGLKYVLMLMKWKLWQVICMC